MNIKHLSPEYAVSPQIDKSDVSEIVTAGFKSVLCNRPDTEIGHDQSCNELRTAVVATGLDFADNQFDHTQFGPNVIERQAKLIESLPKPVLAYCASGTRCTIVWAFTQAGKRPVDEILAAARDQGYALDHLARSLQNYAAD